jgi:formylglycine-generating enzyme
LTGLAEKGLPVARFASKRHPQTKQPRQHKPSMKTQLILSRSILTVCALALASIAVTSARADVFGSGLNQFTLDFVNIGNAGNTDDLGAGGGLYSSPYGGVPYAYRMGTYEISQDAITKAAASGVLHLGGGAWSATQSAANMTWFQAAAFVNWLNTSTGRPAAYQLDTGNTTLTLWSSGQAWQAGGENLYRNKDAYYFLPSENEWYKAAYHQNTGVNADYWDYATGSNTAPTAVASGTTAGTAVYNFPNSSPAAVNNDGGLSAYGTMGQNGNVYEWAESAYDGINNSSSEDREIRGGAWNFPEGYLRSSDRYVSFAPSSSANNVGFRVASVPEPTSTVLMISAGLLALARRRRRAAL